MLALKQEEIEVECPRLAVAALEHYACFDGVGGGEQPHRISRDLDFEIVPFCLIQQDRKDG